MSNTYIVMPDPLTWQAGIEYGLQALAALSSDAWSCSVHNRGRMLESVAFAVHQLNLDGRIKYSSNPVHYGQIALFPRVAALDVKPILFALNHGMKVFVSDPSIHFENTNLFFFPRRNWQMLRDALSKVLE